MINRSVGRLVKIPASLGRPYSKLFIVSDSAGWSLDQDALELLEIARRLNIRGRISSLRNPSRNQCVHYISRSWFRDKSIFRTDNRISFDYYHGNPETSADFRDTYETLKRFHEKIHRIRVSQSEMERLILDSGIDPRKVFRIPIGVNLRNFSRKNEERSMNTRRRLNIPQDAFVVGSFQKDGKGWGDGLEPKMIKGPDIFLKTLEIMKKEVPNLWVLLTGPARGYVKSGLERLGISYAHRFFKDYSEMGDLYGVLDLYIISSREEGGPKALLESMASGVPVVSTRVGQVMDLARHGENSFVVDVEDHRGLASYGLKIYGDAELRNKMISAGYETAKTNSYESQTPQWERFFDGYVES